MIVPTFPRRSETFLVNKFVGLLDIGHDMYVLSENQDEGDWVAFPELKNADMRRRAVTRWRTSPKLAVAFLFPLALVQTLIRRPSKTWAYLGAACRGLGWRAAKRFYLDAKILQLAPEVAHFEFGSSAVNRLPFLSAAGIASVVSFRGHDLDFIGLEDSHYYDDVWAHADVIHCLGDYLWKRAVERGCPPTKARAVIPPAVDLQRVNQQRQQSRADGDLLRILSVGRLTWAKGYDYALQAVAALRDEGVAFDYRIVGEGNYREALEFQRAQFGLMSKVHFLGPLDHTEVLEELAQADIFLHTAVEEGFANSVVEAQALGVATLCSDAGGLPDNVVPDETALVVPRRSVEALVDSLRVLAADADLRARLSAAGRLRGLRFDLQEQVIAFDAVYQGLSDLE